ncbi:hypothetical protein ES702_02652 [subsurface metagenome]
MLTTYSSLASTPRGRLPRPGTIIACSCTSPLDVLYLAAIFDPIFIQRQPGSRRVQPVTLEAALAGCFDIKLPLSFTTPQPPTELARLVKQNANRVIVVFPESTNSNGRGILKLSPSLLSASPNTRIFPISLRYTPAEIVTPIPGWWEAIHFIWRLNSRPTHCIRVRIGAPLTIAAPPAAIASPDTTPRASSKPNAGRRGSAGKTNGFETNFFDTLNSSPAGRLSESSDDSEADGVDEKEKQVLDAVADALARLGRVKRVGLGVEEKHRFVEAWWKGRRARG